MVKVRMTFYKDTPKTVKRDLQLYFTLLKMRYDKDEDIYTITNPNSMDTGIAIVSYIREKNYIKYIDKWESYYSNKEEFDKEDYIYSFNGTSDKFAKIDAKESYLKYHKN